MNSDAMEKPVADQSANNANSHLADETETVALYNLARQPAGNDPDDQNDSQAENKPTGLRELARLALVERARMRGKMKA